MKLRYLSLLLFAASVLSAPLSCAQDETSSDKTIEKADKTKPKKKGENKVGKAIQAAKLISGKCSLKAPYYIIAVTGKAGDAAAQLEELNDLMADLKTEKQVDLLFVCTDAKSADAKKVLSKAKARFGAALASGKGVAQIPGYSDPDPADSTIACTMVDAAGNTVTGGDVAAMKNWKQAIASHEKALEQAEAFASATPVTKEAQALKALKYINAARPNLNAKYFVFLFSAGWCLPCNKEMPDIVKAYQEMLGSEEIAFVMVDCDDNEDAAKAYMAKYGANFPAVMKKDFPATFPGISASAGIPWCFYVSADGEQLFNGHGSNVPRWKNMLNQFKSTGK